LTTHSLPLNFVKTPAPSGGYARVVVRPVLLHGKMVIGEVDRLEWVDEQDNTKIYTTIVNCVNLKRDIRIVYLVKNASRGLSFALLFSTDTELDALSIYQYYAMLNFN